MIIGLLVLATRAKAMTQVVGYLVLENGIFIFGLLLVERMPFLVEVGVLLDLFVGVFVMGIIINHINREFDSLDPHRLTELQGLMPARCARARPRCWRRCRRLWASGASTAPWLCRRGGGSTCALVVWAWIAPTAADHWTGWLAARPAGARGAHAA